MAEHTPQFDYEIVGDRKIRVRPRETVSEIDCNGYFRRQPNHFTTPFGDGTDDLKAEGGGRYRLVWAKLCHWSNRAAIVRELEGLDDQISVNLVEHAPHEKNLGWEYVYNEDNLDPVLNDQFLSEAYYRADDSYAGRTTVPALIDTKTGQVVNNDYNWLTNYLEVQFRPWHKKGAPELYPEPLRSEIDAMNLWLFDNVNNAVYRCAFSQSAQGYQEAYQTLYAALDILEKRLETRRFLFGDYVTDADVRLYVTLARLDIRYTWQVGETKKPLFTYKNLWGYARELWQIPAFRNNTYFVDFAVPGPYTKGDLSRSFNGRFLTQIDIDAFWGQPTDRAGLSKDPLHKFAAEKDAGTARVATASVSEIAKKDREAYEAIRAIKSTKVPDPKTVKVELPLWEDERPAQEQAILTEIQALPDGPTLGTGSSLEAYVTSAVTEPITVLMTTTELKEYQEAYQALFAALSELDQEIAEKRFLLGDHISVADVKLYTTLCRLDAYYSRYINPVQKRLVDFTNLWPYARDLYQIPAFQHHTDFKSMTAVDAEGGSRYAMNAYYGHVLPETDLHALWSRETERAYLSSDPTHPIRLMNNRRFDIDPSWYDLGAEDGGKA